MLNEKKINTLDDATKTDYELGVNALGAKNYVEALEHFNVAFVNNSLNADLYGNMALAFKGLNRLGEARLFYKKALMFAPIDQNLNLAFAQLLQFEKNYDQAIDVLKAIESKIESSIEFYFDLAKCYELKGLFVEAIDHYKKVLHKEKNHLESLFGLAFCYMDIFQKSDATKILKQIIEHENLEEANLIVLVKLLKINESFDDIIKILTKKQSLNEYFSNQLASAFLDRKEKDKAFELYQNILKKNPNSIDALKGLGDYYFIESHYQKSEEYYQKSLAIEENEDVIICYMRLLHILDRVKEAKDLFLKQEQKTLHKLNFYLQTTKIKMDNRLYFDAIALCEKAIEEHPNTIAPMACVLPNYLEIENYEKASYYHDLILTKVPDHETALFSKAITCFTQNKIEEGWRHYEHRLNVKEQFHLKKEELFSESSFWQGEDLKGKTVFIWSEQGIGDEIMFASCYNDIIDKAKMVIIECSDRLFTLLSRSFPKVFFIHRFFELVDEEKKRILRNLNPFRPIDYAIASGSLPLHCRKKIEDFPSKNVYLKPNPFLVKEWLGRYAQFKGTFKIGICWRSGLLNAHRQKYFLKLDDFLPIFALPNITFINLQYDNCEEELQEIEKKQGLQIKRWPDVNLKDDFDVVAAMMVNLDLIITAETSVGELGAALGVEVWRLTGGADWTRLGQKERPWYPSMRSFVRVGEHKWAPLIEQVVEKLKEKNKLYV